MAVTATDVPAEVQRLMALPYTHELLANEDGTWFLSPCHDAARAAPERQLPRPANARAAVLTCGMRKLYVHDLPTILGLLNVASIAKRRFTKPFVRVETAI